MPTLLSIPEEAALCRAAFAGVPVGAMTWHCHHEQIAEPLTEPAKARIAYIRSHKPEAERALRLHLFRPAPDAAVDAAQATYDAVVEAAEATYDAVVEAAWATYDAAVDAARATYDAADKAARATYDAAVEAARATYDAVVEPAHRAECPDCPWNGRTIFP